MIISLGQELSFLSPNSNSLLILALAHSVCFMGGRVMAENEMKGNGSFGGEKGREPRTPTPIF